MYIPLHVIYIVAGIVAVALFKEDGKTRALIGVFSGMMLSAIVTGLFVLGYFLMKVWAPLALLPAILAAVVIYFIVYSWVDDFRAKRPLDWWTFSISIGTIVAFISLALSS